METAERRAVRKAMDDLKPYLASYVATHSGSSSSVARKDMAGLLNSIITEWDAVYSRSLAKVVRAYIHELKDVRNRWAHEEPFSKTEMSRALNTIKQVSLAIGAPLTTHQTRQVSPFAKKPSQRDVMRDIYSRYHGKEDRVIAEYAAAERAGKVQRIGNKSGHTAEQYAAALLNDGLKKGWLP
jgi:hypothetical protein